MFKNLSALQRTLGTFEIEDARSNSAALAGNWGHVEFMKDARGLTFTTIKQPLIRQQNTEKKNLQ